MNLKNNFNKIKYYFRRYGIFATLKRILKRIFHIKENRKTNIEQYKIWMQKNNPNEEELANQRNHKFNVEPKISIVVPMYNTNEAFFKELIESLINQTYQNWELCLADGSENQNENLKKYYEKDKRIKYKFLNSNEGISENTNKAIEMTNGEFIGFLDHDDLLPKEALYEIAKAINENVDVDFLYTDEDKIDEYGERFEPYFKPDYSPETLECNNYITHFVVVKKELIERVGNLNSEFNGAQDFDFVLRISEVSEKIVHISKILYHWRMHKASTANVADAKPYAFEAGRKAVEEHLKRTGRKGTVENGQDVPGIYKIKYDVIDNPKVSILIPNKDNINLLKKCINSILKLTTYDNYEIVIIENNSEKQETFKYYQELIKNPKIKVLNYNKNLKLDINGETKLFTINIDSNIIYENEKEKVISNNCINEESQTNSNAKKEFNYSALINFGVKNIQSDFILQLNNDTEVLIKEWLELFIGYAEHKEIGAVGARLYYEDKSIQHAGISVRIIWDCRKFTCKSSLWKTCLLCKRSSNQKCISSYRSLFVFKKRGL